MNYVELNIYSETYYNKNYENQMVSLMFISQVEQNIVHSLFKLLCIDWKVSTEHTVLVGHVSSQIYFQMEKQSNMTHWYGFILINTHSKFTYKSDLHNSSPKIK